MSVQVGASYLEKERAGAAFCSAACRGTPGECHHSRGGIVGTNAARIALGFGAKTR